MPTPPFIAEPLLRQFQITAPEVVADTSIATIFRVQRADGALAALKLYKAEGMGNEAAGVAYLTAMRGRGAVQIHARHDNALLMEWLEGPTLGELSRQGQDQQATQRLARTAQQLHGNLVAVDRPLTDLHTWFAALFTARFDPEGAADLRRNIQRAQQIARVLLGTQRDIRPLHGDLHHENVIQSPRGDLSFDAKGLSGERAYELANAFRHPLDRPDLVRDGDRIRQLAGIWAAALHTTGHRLLQWAAAKCALSILWRNTPALRSDGEAELLALLLTILDQDS